ncbi:MAG: hypothetical protein L0Z62_36905, partial [Gemmataceae bacterium]|nr:hypothetical protein [Gemmataceae bacterium]
ELASAWPRAVPFEELLRSARGRAGEVNPPEADRERLALALMSLLTGTRLVELSTTPPRFVTSVSARPVAHPVARYQARHGRLVPNGRHETVTLEEPARQVLLRLDGTRHFGDLVEGLVDLVQRGVLALRPADRPDTPPVREQVTQGLRHILPELARLALLVG